MSSYPAAERPILRGVNLAGAEFGFEGSGRGAFGTAYIYPTSAYVEGYRSPEYFLSKGMNTFRLPFRWERLQPVRKAPFDPAEWQRLQTTVDQLIALDATVILDPHNGARYAGDVIGTAAVPNADFANLWQRLAKRFGDQPKVVFGLMNEPHDMPTEQWVAAANGAIAAIRGAGAENLILVPGNGWSGAHAWASDAYGTPNAKALLAIEDPAGNVAFEAHQYLDDDSSGTSSTCVSPTIGAERLQPFTDWLKAHGKKGFLGEFGAGSSNTCLAALAGILEHIEANAAHYLGWTYWAAGPWWSDYFMSLEPDGSVDAPQMRALAPYL
jgi:endoglucanase